MQVPTNWDASRCAASGTCRVLGHNTDIIVLLVVQYNKFNIVIRNDKRSQLNRWREYHNKLGVTESTLQIPVDTWQRILLNEQIDIPN